MGVGGGEWGGHAPSDPFNIFPSSTSPFRAECEFPPGEMIDRALIYTQHQERDRQNPQLYSASGEG
jgi:hypothetical protein